MKPSATGPMLIRRRLLQGAAAWAVSRALPSVAAPELPALADNGLAVPMKLAMSGPFAPGPTVQAIHLFSEKNPVPDMAVFEFPVPLEKIEIDSRVRLAGTQKVVAVAVMSDAALYAAMAEVVVTIAACLDGS